MTTALGISLVAAIAVIIGLSAKLASLKRQLREQAMRDEETREREAALLRERDFLQALMNHIPDQIYFKDPQSRFILINQSCAKTVGAKSPEDAVGKCDHDYFRKEDADSFKADDTKVIQSGEALLDRIEKAVINGVATWMSTTKAPLRGPDGKVVGIVGISRDVTDRKHAEEALENERELLRLLMESTPDHMYFKDTESRFTRVNNAVAKDTPFKTPENMIGKTDFDLWPDQSMAQQFRDEEIQVMATGKAIVDKTEMQVFASGQRWYSITKAPIIDKNGKAIGIVGVNRDITERKRAEELLKDVLDHAQCILWYADVRDTELPGVFDWNFKMLSSEPVRRWLGLDLTGKKEGEIWAKQILPEHLAAMNRRSAEAIHGGEPGYTQEFCMRGHDGSLRWMFESVGISPLAKGRWHLVGVVTDITDRKHAEEALGEERRLLRTVIDNLPDAIYCKDTEGKYMLSNKRDMEVLGIKSPEEQLNKTVYDFFSKEFADIFFNDDMAVIRSGEALLNREEPIRTRLGEEMWLSTTKVPLRNSAGKVVGLVGISSNITERRRIQVELDRERELLRENEARLRLIVQQVPAILWTTDLELRFTSSVGAGLVSMNLKPNQVVGLTLYEFFKSNDPDLLPLSAHLRALKGESVSYEYTFADRAFHTTVEPMRDQDGSIKGTIGIALDITEQHRVREALREREYLLRQVLDTNPNIIFVKDRGSRIVLANEALAEFYNLPLNELKGVSQFDLHVRQGHPIEDVKRWINDDVEVIDNGRPKQIIEHVTRRDGTQRWYRTKKLPLKLANGVSSVLVIAEDITDLKSVEAELAKERDLLQALMDNVPDNIYFKDTASKFIRVNRQQAIYLGVRDPNAAVGKTDFDFYPNEEAREFFGDEQQILSGVRIIGKVEKQSVIGTPERWTLTSKVPFYNREGAVIGIVGVSKDITALKQMETQLAEANEQLNKLARLDSLTGLLNRRMILELMDTEWARWQRYGKAFSVMVIDADNFKLINDRYGHLVGDQALKLIASRLTQSIRAVDTVGRYGGEEFVVLLPETPLEGAIAAGEKILQNIRRNGLKHNDMDVVTTVSVGIASVMREDRDIDAVLHRADTALYAAKRSGKDKLVALPPDGNPAAPANS